MVLGEFFVIGDSPLFGVLVWGALFVTFLYLSRAPARRLILSLARLGHQALRLGAAATVQAGKRLEARNREVLLANGREAKERIIEREFERIGATVERDLSRYPEIQRTLAEAIQRIDDDHQQTSDVPPEVPGWTKAVEAIAKVPAKADPSVRQVLEAIHGAVSKAQRQSLRAYREASRERHRLLSRMMPEWRRIQNTLGEMLKAVSSLLERSRSIDRHMLEYRDIVHGTDRALTSLSASALVTFAISALVIGVAIGGAVINFSLIARPMAEMVGGTSYIGSFQTADIAALVIIMVEISMGLFLMESLRITRLFPVIAALPDRLRVRMIWITLTILTLLASVEAGLAYMRELLLQDELATSALLRGEDAAVLAGETLWITTAAQMGMGFILPFALTFVAIPLESFIQSVRTVIGMLFAGILRALALSMRLLGNLIHQIGGFLVNLYDLVIFAPLWVELRWQQARERRQGEQPPESGSYAASYGEVSL